jgi:diguanylate cyclase (GGDEF)-like protein
MHTFKNLTDIRIKLFQIYTIISLLAIVIYVGLFFILGVRSAVLLQIVFIIPFGLALRLIQKSRTTLAIIIAIFSSITVVLLQTFLIFSNMAGFHYQYFSLIVVIFLVNDMHVPSQKRLTIVLTFLTSIAFVFCDQYANTPYLKVFNSIDYGFIRSFSLGVNLVAMFILLYIYSVQLSKKDQLMVYLACHDSLTNLYNAGHFNHLGNEFFKKHQTSSEPLSLMLLDIDDFKNINNQYSHAGGDVALVSLANRIHTLLQTSAIFSRYGGKEFAILLPNMNESQAWELAETIRSSIEEMSIFYSKQIFDITVSIGLIHMNDLHNSFDDMVFQADEFLYNSRRSGKNKVTMMIK